MPPVFPSHPYIAGAPILRGMLLKRGTSLGRVIPLTTTVDGVGTCVGVAESDAFTGDAVAVASVYGSEVEFYSDGSATIADGDDLAVSLTVAGAVKSQSGGGVGKAYGSAPAQLGASIKGQLRLAGQPGLRSWMDASELNVVVDLPAPAQRLWLATSVSANGVFLDNVAQTVGLYPNSGLGFQVSTVAAAPGSDVAFKHGTSVKRFTESWAMRRGSAYQRVVVASGVAQFDLTLGSTFILQLSSSAVGAGGVTFAGTPLPGETITLMVYQDTTARTLTQAGFANFLFAGGAYTVTPTANKVDAIQFVFDPWNGAALREVGRSLNMSL